MSESTSSIPTFQDYVQHQKYKKNVSPRTLLLVLRVEYVFGAVDVHKTQLSTEVKQAQLEKCVKPFTAHGARRKILDSQSVRLS